MAELSDSSAVGYVMSVLKEKDQGICTYIDTPIGYIQIKSSDKLISSIEFVEEKYNNDGYSSELNRARSQVVEYLQGERKQFDFPIRLNGTPFQKKVWTVLQSIPYGITVSYFDIAKSIGHPRAMRAVGAANRSNPIGIVVPCHRVIGKNGTLTGYAGGLHRKAWLLTLEQKYA